MLSPKQVSKQATDALSLLDIVKTAEKYKKQIQVLKDSADELEGMRKDAVGAQKLANESIEKADEAWKLARSGREKLVEEKAVLVGQVKAFEDYSKDVENEAREDQVNLQNFRDSLAGDMKKCASKEKELAKAQEAIDKRNRSLRKREDKIAETEKKLNEVFK